MRGEEFSRLVKQFDTCKGMEIHHRISELRSSFESTTQAYFLLKRPLVSFSNLKHAIWLMDYDHQERMNAFFLDVRRNLSSYLASARALTDYMERVMKSEPSNTLKEQYKKRVNKTLWSPLGCFFRSLANYSLHHSGLPIGIVHKGVAGKQDESYVKLDAKRLLEWNGWDRGEHAKKGKEYVQSLGEEVRILDKIEEYHPMLAGFYVWFHNELIEAHQTELDELESLRRRITQ